MSSLDLNCVRLTGRSVFPSLTLVARNQKFVEAALAFPEDVFLAAEILRIMPGVIAPYVFLSLSFCLSDISVLGLLQV